MSPKTEPRHSIDTVKDYAHDYAKTARWVRIEGATYRLIGIGRKHLRIMHPGTGKVSKAEPERVQLAW